MSNHRDPPTLALILETVRSPDLERKRKMPSDKSLWYRIGYAMERARLSAPAGEEIAPAKRKGKKKRQRLPALSKVRRSQRVVDTALAVGAGTLATRVLRFWPTRHRAGVIGLMRAAASGAAASVCLRLLQPHLVGKGSTGAIGQELPDLLLSGVGRGLIYGAVVEPRVPGPSLLQGAAYASLEYLVAPWGGLEGVLGKESPQGRLPVLTYLFRADNPGEMHFLDHLVFGVTLALLYRR